MATDNGPLKDKLAPLRHELAATQPFDRNEFDAELPYMGFRPGVLSGQQEKFVHLVVSGMPNAAAAVAVGAPTTQATSWMKKPEIIAAIEYFRDKNREKLNFTIETAHSMLMEAWTNSKDATEQVAVVRELVKLHGVAVAPKPQEVNINVTNRKQVERASDEKLLELAGVEATYLLPIPKKRDKLAEPVIEADYSEVAVK